MAEDMFHGGNDPGHEFDTEDDEDDTADCDEDDKPEEVPEPLGVEAFSSQEGTVMHKGAPLDEALSTGKELEGLTIEEREPIVRNKPYHSSARTAEDAEEQQQDAKRPPITSITSPCTQVTGDGAVEITEAIFAWLPMLDLIRAKRVCRSWKKIIATSEVLQQSLFLRPFSDKQVHFHADWHAMDATGTWSTSPDRIEPVDVCVNPMVHHHPQHFLPDSSLRSKGVPAFNTLPEPKICQCMLATNPPMAAIQFWVPIWDSPSQYGLCFADETEQCTIIKGVSLPELHRLVKNHEKPGAIIPQLSSMQEIKCGMDIRWFRCLFKERQADLLREEVNRLKLKMKENQDRREQMRQIEQKEEKIPS